MKNSLVTLVLFVSVLSLNVLSGCKRSADQSADEGSTETSTTSSPEPTPRDAFERDLQYVRRGRFKYVWVFSRKDGKALDKADGEFLKAKAPQVVDWVGSDEGKRFIIAGSNFAIEPPMMEALRKRFKVEDYSGK